MEALPVGCDVVPVAEPGTASQRGMTPRTGASGASVDWAGVVHSAPAPTGGSGRATAPARPVPRGPVLLAALLLALAADADQAAHVDLARPSLAGAEQLHGRIVSVWVEVGKPVVTTDDGRTLIGVEDRDEGRERVVILCGERLDVDEGQRLVVVGRKRPTRSSVLRN